MKNLALITLSSVALLIAGCAATPPRSDVIIDPDGVDMAEYERDLAECRQIARQVPRRGGRGAVAGAVVGGALGGIGGREGGTERGAKAGAVLGGLKGAKLTRLEQRKVLKNCIRNRGYTVLN
jgi:outer membrane lipoprotein SlyB